MKRRLSWDVDEAWNEVPGYLHYGHRHKMNRKGEHSNYDNVINIEDALLVLASLAKHYIPHSQMYWFLKTHVSCYPTTDQTSNLHKIHYNDCTGQCVALI